MDGTEDSSYLTLLNDGSNNYLLQTTEETLGVEDPNLHVEPIFTEIEDGPEAWSVGLPVLMNGNLIPEADQELQQTSVELPEENNTSETGMDIPESLPELYENSLENQESLPEEAASEEENQLAYPIEIPGKGFITADGLFIANDILLELKLEDENLNLPEATSTEMMKIVEEPHTQEPVQRCLLINPKTLVPYSGSSSVNGDTAQCNTSKIKRKLPHKDADTDVQKKKANIENGSSEDQEKSNTSGDIIRLLNCDGTVININKDDLDKYNVIEDEEEEEPAETNGVTMTLEENNENMDEFFDVVMAHKCKQCIFLCETREEIIEHLRKDHLAVTQALQHQAEEENNTTVVQNQFNGEVTIMKSILKNNDHQTVFLCSECNLGYGSTQKLKDHMIAVHDFQTPGEKAAAVAKEEKEIALKKTKRTLAKIQKQAKALKKIKCSVKGCDLRFALEEMRVRHEKCHVIGQKKQFKCFECDNKFSLWRVCSLHLWKCHNMDLGLLTCPMCSVHKATSAVRLMTHMAIHEEDKPYLCSDCGKTFKQGTQLRNHEVLHQKMGNATALPEWAAQQQCEICKKFFANSKSLKKHVQIVHDKFKPFICNICGHKTARKAMLDLHLRQHTGEKPHKCPICEYKTGDHNSLRRHVMRHSGDTKYSCPHCSYSSIQSTSYKNHIASKHPGLGGSYFCSLCSYHTVNENTYVCHLADHRNGLINQNCDNDGGGVSLSKTPSQKDDKRISNNRTEGNKISDTDDDETQNLLSLLDQSNDAVDTGGITIPAELELEVPL